MISDSDGSPGIPSETVWDADYNPHSMSSRQPQPDALMRFCAYCGSTADLTREHVIPAFIEDFENERGTDKSITNVRAGGKDKPVQGSITIGDVCRTCNNGFLSELDGYGASLYKQFFAVPPRSGQTVPFIFDYDKLLRWLLKLAYNAGRSRGWHSKLLQPLRDSIAYLRGKAGRPAAATLYLQLITPARLSKQQRATVEAKTGEKIDEIPPDFRRITVFAQQGIVAGYRVAMNGYVFYVLFANPNSKTRQLRTLEKRFYSETKGAKRLDPNTTKAVIYPSSLSILDVAKREPLLQATLAATTRWVEQRKKR